MISLPVVVIIVDHNPTHRAGAVISRLAGALPIPVANVRIGFAFHKDPQSGPTGRFPANEQLFVRNLQDPDFLAWVQANGAPRYVQWDVIFDMSFAGLGLTPSTPRQELHFLRLPFRF